MNILRRLYNKDPFFPHKLYLYSTMLLGSYHCVKTIDRSDDTFIRAGEITMGFIFGSIIGPAVAPVYIPLKIYDTITKKLN